MTIKNVELVSVGTHAAETGTVTLTAEDMTSMAEAYADHFVDRPYIKLGHDNDNVFNTALGDGEPAYGWIENVGVGDGSAERPKVGSLYGDIVGMPSKLEEVAPKAFRRRSVEIAHQVKAASGKAYRAVLTHLALLGVKKPAVKGLDDMLALYSEMESAESVSTVVMIDGLDAEQTTKLGELIDALDQVSEIDTANVPPAPAAGGESESDDKSKNKENPMPITKADVDKALEAASGDDVTDIIAKLLTPPETDEAKAQREADEKAAADKAAADAAVAAAEKIAAAEAETVTIAKDTLTQLSEGAAAGVAAKAEVDKARRDGIIRSALSEGRIAPAEQKTWRDQLEANEETTVTLLGSLSPRFATSEIGSDLGSAVVTELGENDQRALDEWSDKNLGTSLLSGADK